MRDRYAANDVMDKEERWRDGSTCQHQVAACRQEFLDPFGFPLLSQNDRISDLDYAEGPILSGRWNSLWMGWEAHRLASEPMW